MRGQTKIAFTPEEIALIQRAVLRVWDYVAYDCLQATAEEKGKDVESVTISRRDVIEISLDAGRPEEELRKMKVDAGLIERFNTAPYAQLQQIAKGAFTYARYGV